MYDFLIAGNGIVGVAIASGLIESHPNLRIGIIGPAHRPFSASMAAAAMLNSFAELEPGALDEERDRVKFVASNESGRMWPDFLDRHGIPRTHLRLGTVVISNTTSNELDDANFAAIQHYLDEWKEPWQSVDPKELKGYMPTARSRALRALFIPDEGWVNPDATLLALSDELQHRGVDFIDGRVAAIDAELEVQSLVLDDGSKLAAGRYIVANGSYASDLVNASGLERKIVRIIHGVGCSLVLDSDTVRCEHVIRTPNRGLACGVYHVPYGGNSFVVGATNLLTTAPESYARAENVFNLVGGAIEQVNVAHGKSRLRRVNLGYRPTALDVFPVIGWACPNLYIASGTKRDGYHFAPYLAAACSRHLLEGTRVPLMQFTEPLRRPYSFGTLEQCATKFAHHKVSAAFQHGFSGGHTDLPKQWLESTRRDTLRWLTSSGLRHGIAVELMEPLINGHLALAEFQ